MIGGLQSAEVPDPLGQFQSNLANKEGTQKLLKAINSALAEKKLEEDVLNDTFEKYWPDLEKVLQNLPTVKGEVRPRRKVEDMVREILDIVRAMPFKKHTAEEINTIASSVSASVAALSYPSLIAAALSAPPPDELKREQIRRAFEEKHKEKEKTP